MGKKKKVDGRQLRAAMRDCLQRAWLHGRELHPEDTPYAFVLYGVEDTPRLTPHLLTEEALIEVASRYQEEGYYESLEEAANDLRYSVADSPHFNDLLNDFDEVDQIFNPVAESLGETEGYKRLAEIAMKAMNDLIDQGLFSETKKQRERVLLTIITEDATVNWSLKSAEKLNSPTVFRRYKKATEVSGVYKSGDEVVISPSGDTIYFTVYYDDRDYSELVAADLRGIKISRRWSFRYASFGGTMGGLAIDPRDDSLVALHSYSDRKREWCARLLRFAPNSNKPVAIQEGFEGFESFSFDAETSEITIGFEDHQLRLDSEFQVLQRREFPAAAQSCKLLNRGVWLGQSENGLKLILPKSGKVKAEATTPFIRCFAFDDAEKKIVVSRDSASEDFDEGRAEEFGFQLLRLPSLKPLRSIEVPGHQATYAQISADGSMVACCLSATQSERHYVAVFDTKSGRELGRCRAEYLQKFRFAPHLRAILLVTGSFIDKNAEPLKFWPIPK